MKNLNNIIIYLGSNLKGFVVLIFLKFILYMALLTILLITFFSSTGIINGKLFTILTIAFLVIMNFLINRKILIHHTLLLLKKMPVNENNSIQPDVKLNLKEWRETRKRVSGFLKSMVPGYITTEFTDCFTLMNIISKESQLMARTDIRNLYRDHIKQKFAQAGISFLTALPFFSISILFTVGYKYELKMLSLILAVIFFLFIRSAIITPVFSLITLNKIAERLNS